MASGGMNKSMSGSPFLEERNIWEREGFIHDCRQSVVEQGKLL